MRKWERNGQNSQEKTKQSGKEEKHLVVNDLGRARGRRKGKRKQKG